MEYTTATQAVRDNLAAGTDEFAAVGALDLALQAWRTLAAQDTAWDRLGLELIDVQGRLYPYQDVTVEAAPPRDSPQTRAAVRELLESLAQHHEAMATATGPLAQRLDHDATAHQLRHAAAALA